MRHSENSFRHESLQDAKSIRALLESVTEGIAKGSISFSDEDGEIVMEPQGLLQLRLTATQDGSFNRINIRIGWQAAEDKGRKRSLNVRAGTKKP